MWLDDGRQPSGKRAEFYLKAKQDAEATKQEGRPIFQMVEYVRIEIPADKSLVVDRPVRDGDKEEFRKQYEAFKSNKDQDTASGTLLSATGLLPPERIEELAFFKIRTVEQLAAVTDSNLPNLGMHARAERQRCRDFVEAAKSNAPLLRLQAQTEQLENEKATMAQQLAQLQAAVDELRKAPASNADKAWGDEADEVTAVERPRRGRPPKHVEG